MKNNNRFDYIVFDVDGTLLDTTDGILSAVEYTIKKKKLPPLSEEQLLTFIGPPIYASFQKVYGQLEKDKIDEVVNIFRERYKKVDLLKARPYADIYQTCQRLIQKGIIIGVATYKRQDYAEEILKYFHFDQYSRYLFGSDSCNCLKKSDIIRNCIVSMKVKDDSKVLMIGDSINDSKGAMEAGISFLGVTYGFGFKNREEILEAGAIGCACTPLEILDFV